MPKLCAIVDSSSPCTSSSTSLNTRRRSLSYCLSFRILTAFLGVAACVGIELQAHELANAGFEAQADRHSVVGWDVRLFGHAVEYDFNIKYEGDTSLKLVSGENPKASSLRQGIPSSIVRERAHRFKGQVRTADLSGTASLFVIVNESGQRRFMDYMRGRWLRGDTEWTPLELVIPQFPNAESVIVGVLVDGVGSAWFDALDLEPIDTAAPMSIVASDYLDAALEIMEKHSIHRTTTDWAYLRRQTRIVAAGAQSTRDTYPAIEYAIYSLGDHHSEFYTPSRASALQANDADVNSLPSWTSPQGHVIDETIGYVTIPPFSGLHAERKTRYADELQNLIADLDSERICGWIVDLRQNYGGSVFPMLAGVGPILGEGNAGGGITAGGKAIFRSYKNGRSGDATVSGEPYSLVNPMPPVAVLIGPGTGSSGEAVALGFVGRPETETFGQPSGGLTTGNAPFSLDDGAILNLAITRMMDRNGKTYGDKIEPGVTIIAKQSNEQSADPVVQAAAGWLGGKCASQAGVDLGQAAYRQRPRHGRRAAPLVFWPPDV